MASTSIGVTSETSTNTNEEYQCEICTVFCQDTTFLNIHYYMCHRKNNKYECNKCSYRSSNLKNVTKHIKMHFYVLDNYCVICDEHFNTVPEYLNHQNVHKFMMSNMFRCDICKSERFKYYSFHSLQLHHKEWHLNKPYICDMCDFTYKTKEDLDKHRSFHLKKVLKPFNCKICNEQYDYVLSHFHSIFNST